MWTQLTIPIHHTNLNPKNLKAHKFDVKFAFFYCRIQTFCMVNFIHDESSMLSLLIHVIKDIGV